MKTMLYVGATLMIGASIYGFVDYKQTHNKKEFREMYTEEKPVVHVVKEEKEPAKTMNTEEKQPVAKEKKTISRSNTEVTEEVTRSVKPISESEKMLTAGRNITEDKPLTIEPSKESSIVKVVKKKRKVRREIFSRAPLRDEEEIIVEPVKTEPARSDKKEQ